MTSPPRHEPQVGIGSATDGGVRSDPADHAVPGGAEGHRSQHEVGAQVGCGGRRRARGDLPTVHPRSAAVLGAAGAAGGKLRQLHHRRELAERLETAIAPGHSGLVALVSDPGAVRIRKALQRADAIVESAVDDATARAMKAAAKDAGSTDAAASDQA